MFVWEFGYNKWDSTNLYNVWIVSALLLSLHSTVLGGAKGSCVFIINIYCKTFFYIIKFTSWIKYLLCDSEASNKQDEMWN